MLIKPVTNLPFIFFCDLWGDNSVCVIPGGIEKLHASFNDYAQLMSAILPENIHSSTSNEKLCYFILYIKRKHKQS